MPWSRIFARSLSRDETRVQPSPIALTPVTCITNVLCGVAACLAVGVLIGWLIESDALKSLIPGLTTMKPNTAVGLLALSIGVINARSRQEGSVRGTAVGLISGLLAFTLGLATLAQYAFGVRFGIDELLFSDPDTTSAPFNGRMSPATALSFVTLGLATVVLHQARGRSVLLAHCAALPSGAIGALSIVGYAYGVERLYNFGPYVSVALHTAIGLCAMSLAVLLRRADQGWCYRLIDRPIAHTVFVRLLAWAVVLPFTVGLLVLGGVKLGFYDALFTPALFAVATTGMLIWLSFGAANGALRAELALNGSQEQFRVFAEAVPNHVWAATPLGVIYWFNGQVEVYSGKSTAELLELGWGSILHPDDAQAAIGAWTAALASGASYETEFRIQRFDGAYRWFLVRSEPVRSDSGSVVQWVGTNTDIDDQKRTFAELQDLNASLAHRIDERTREANHARRQAEVASQAKSDFLASMSHEIRTPLNGVIGYADLLCEEPDLTPAARQHAERIRSAGSALLTVVNDVLDVSKIDAGQVEIVRQPFSLDALLEGSLAIVRGSAENKGLALNVTLGRDLPAWVLGDHNRLRQVLLNLCNNAIKFTKVGWVGLSVDTIPRTGKPSGLRFRVTDTGIGVQADKRERLFRRFSQADGSISRDFGGTGLGLSISKSLIELMGGTIGFDSEAGRGSTFWFEVDLPVADAQTSPSTFVQSPGQRVGKRLLLAEDVPMNQDIARAVLERAGHSVDVVGDGAAAVAAVRTKIYDLVLMDVQMPILDGISATRQIRALTGTAAQVPVVAMTANVLPDQIEGFLAAGMNGHVGKPYRADALLNVVDRFSSSNVVFQPGPSLADQANFEDITTLVGHEQVHHLLALLAEELGRRFSPASVADREGLAQEAHAMISATASLGFTELAQICREVEASCRAGGNYKPMLATLHLRTAETIAKIEMLRAA